jgi:hypothetical protein
VSKIKLSGPQLSALKSLPRTMHKDYRPIRHLVLIGFANESERSFGQNYYERTPAGEAYLSAMPKRKEASRGVT